MINLSLCYSGLVLTFGSFNDSLLIYLSAFNYLTGTPIDADLLYNSAIKRKFDRYLSRVSSITISCLVVPTFVPLNANLDTR